MQLLLALIWTRMMTCIMMAFFYGVYFSSCLGLAWTSCTLLVGTRRGVSVLRWLSFPRRRLFGSRVSERPRTRTLFWVSDPMVHGHLKSGAHRGPSAQLSAINNYLSRQLSTLTTIYCSNYLPQQLRSSTIAQ
jgi:hypothetical protein